MSRPLHNQILAVKGLSSGMPVPTGFSRVTVPPESTAGEALQVFASPETTLRIHSDIQSDVHVYLWGLAAHRQLQRSEIPRWIAARIAHGEATALRQIVGCFIALIDDRRSRSVSIVNDVVGTRPFFVGLRNNTLVCGSHVWTLAELGWIGKKPNYDSIAAWIRAGYDFTEGALFSDVSLIEPGAVTTYRDDRTCVKPYAQFQGGCHKPRLDDLLDNIHGSMTRSFETETRELGPFQIALSGGYDSRYLAALARSHGMDLRAACLKDKPSEAIAAAEVARRLGFALNIIETDGTRWNAYDEPFHFAPSGFPITKQQSYPAVMQHPGLPCLNGFLGGELIRETVDRLDGKLPSETTEDLGRVFQRAQNLMPTFARFDLVEADILARCDERTLPACRRHIARYRHTANVFTAAMCLRRHRTFFGNNFVQYLSMAEPILPFANFDLLEIRNRTHPDLFAWETYEALFARFYPKIADILHNDRIPCEPKPGKQLPSALTPHWASETLRAILFHNGLRILNPRKTIPRLIGALRGAKNTEVVAQYAYQLHLLERRLLDVDIELDWDAI